MASTRLGAAFAIALAVCAPGTAQAQMGGWTASADFDLDAGYMRSSVAGAGDDRDGEASFGLRLGGTGGKNAVQYAASFGYRLGVSHPGGFLYAVELLPIGVGIVVSDRFRIVARGGAGISGVTSRVPFAGDFPIEARIELRLTRWLGVGAFARVAWTTADERAGGVTSIDFGDELDAGVRIRIGRHYDHGGGMRGNDGYYVAALVSEAMGSRLVGGVFGYAIDFAAGD